MFLDEELNDDWVLLNCSEAYAIETELAREVTSEHLLFNKRLNAIATRLNSDDFLFAGKKNDDRLFVVHLTWNIEISPEWPTVDIYLSKVLFLAGIKAPPSIMRVSDLPLRESKAKKNSKTPR